MPAYQFVPGRGTVILSDAPVSEQAPVDPDDEDDAPEPVVARQQAQPALAVKVKAQKPLSPRDVVRCAKARLREINRELRRIRALERERDQLARLVAAAENKPLAVVRELPKRSHA